MNVVDGMFKNVSKGIPLLTLLGVKSIINNPRGPMDLGLWLLLELRLR